jgi:two-component system, NtrC family, sensor kinase
MKIGDWKLRTKQLASFGLVLLIMSAVHFYTIHNMRAIRVELDEVAQTWLPRALAISDVNLSTSRLRITQLQHTLTADTARRQALMTASVELIDQINSSLDDYRELRTGAREHARFSEQEWRHYDAFDVAWEEYQDLSFAFYELLAEDEVHDAVVLLNAEGQQVFARLNASLAQLVSVNRLQSMQAAERASQTFHSARGISTLLLLGTVLLSVFVAGALMHLISGPVTELEKASREVARGDLNVQLAVHSSDEIGSLGNSFNQMTQALRQARAEGEQQAEQLRLQNQDLAAAMRGLEDTQQQLLLREKMASLGDLVAGVTHELNTPIGAARSGVDVANRCVQRIATTLAGAGPGMPPDTTRQVERSLRILQESLENGQLAMDRITAIVESLRNFARLDQAEYQMADVHEGIDSTLTLMHAELLGRIVVEKRYGDIPDIHCNPGQLNQVFRILLKNAADAFDDEGRITITTELRDERLHIDVADTGRGIAAERLGRLFDFGFTKGASRVRLSSGLPTAYNIMQQHQGDIRLESEPGQGTTVYLELPLQQPVAT